MYLSIYLSIYLSTHLSIDNVHFQHAAQLIEALVNRNVQFKLQVRRLTMPQYHTLVCYYVVTGYMEATLFINYHQVTINVNVMYKKP